MEFSGSSRDITNTQQFYSLLGRLLQNLMQAVLQCWNLRKNLRLKKEFDQK